MSEKKGANKLLVILLIITLVVLIAVGGLFGYYVFIKPKSSIENKVDNSIKQQKPVNEKIIVLDEIITNLADETRSKYIKIKLSIGYENKKLEKEIPQKMSAIRNSILKYLMNKSSEDLRVPEIDKAIGEIKNQINSILQSGEVTNIYINDFIIQ